MSNNEKLSANIEEYLEAIYKISQQRKMCKNIHKYQKIWV